MVGKRKIFIDGVFIRNSLAEGKTIVCISKDTGISLRTLKRRLNEAKLSPRVFTEIGDDELMDIVSDILRRCPEFGFVRITGAVSALGIKVQRKKLRMAYSRVVVSLNLPFHRGTERRVYFVRSPLSLWHIDGNHKLVRWGIVKHRGIDGFSRVIVFLKASTNNKAATVLKSFIRATNHWGLPSRVRSDKGGENVKVGDFIIRKRGMGRNSFIAGTSVHNQRIERLWRDVFTATGSFYTLFYQMEDMNILEHGNAIDKFCLQTTVMPLLQKTLDLFIQSWNFHPLRTEGNNSPVKLFELGLKQMEKNEDPEEPFTELEQELTDEEMSNDQDIVRCENIELHEGVEVEDEKNPLN